MNDALRQLAELHLLDRLVTDRYEVSRQDERSSRRELGVPQRAAGFAEHTAALRAIGALSDREAQAWEARFAAEVNAGAKAPDPGEADMPDRLRGLLDDLIDSSARERTGASTRRDISPFEHALFALGNCGAISRAERDRWYERFLTHPELPDEVRDALRTARADVRAAQRPRPSYATLERVIIGPSSVLGDIQITHAELYSDGSRLFWQRRVSAENPATSSPVVDSYVGRLAHDTRPAPELSDDLGMHYDASPTLADTTTRAKSSHVAFETATYAPGVQAGATRLEICHRQAVLHLALDR